MNIKLQFSLTSDDLREMMEGYPQIARQLRAARGRRPRIGIILWGTFVSVVYGGMVAWEVRDSMVRGEPRSTQMVLIVGALAVVALIIGFVMVVKRYESTKLIRRLKRNPALAPETQMVLTEDGILTTTETFSGTIKWSHFCHCFETKTAFVLSDAQRHATMLPKRAFGAGEAEVFRAFAQAHVGNNVVGFSVEGQKSG